MRENSSKERFLTLTDREREVLQLVCKHKSYQEIADQLFIAKTTVKKHMFKVYNELGLHDKKKTERILAIHNVYCPMFSEVDESKEDDAEIEIIDVTPEPPPPEEEEIIDVTQEPESILSDEEEIVGTNSEPESKSPDVEEIIDVTPEPEPLSPDEEEIIDGDEMALITYTPEPIIGGKKKMGTKKKRSCVKYIFVLVLGVLLTIGAWQAWQYIKDIPIVTSIIELVDPGVTTETNSEASSETKSELSTIVEPVISSIKSSLSSSAGAYDVGEWHKEGDVWIKLADYEVARGYIRINFEIWNKTDQDIYFSWSPEQNFSMVDNKNNRYDVFETSTREVTVGKDERLDFTGHGYSTVQFDDDPLYGSGVTDLYITMEYLSRIDKAVFHISVGN